MSGFEIAGVILGGIPLVVAGLEHYSNGVRTLQYMKNFAMVFEDCKTQLDASLAIYMNTCHSLLLPLNLTDSDLSTLIFERKVEAWSSLHLQAALKQRLGEHQQAFLSLQEKLHKRICKFQSKLKLNEHGQPPWITSNGTVDENARKRFFRNLWVKTTGGLNADRHKNLLSEIDHDIDKLSKLASGSTQLEPIRQEKRLKLQSAHYQRVREHAQRLFDTFSSRFSPCHCTHIHQANLHLDIEAINKEHDTGPRFAFVMTFDKQARAISPPPWAMREIEVKSVQNGHATISVTGANPTPPSKIGRVDGSRQLPSLVLPSTTAPPRPRSTGAETYPKIDSFCEALVAAGQHDHCLGVLEDDAWQHRVYSVTCHASNIQYTETSSVRDIIHGSKGLGPRQKCLLALTLATSVLRLYDTSWLPYTWDIKDIYFLKSNSGFVNPARFYVSRTFSSPQQAAAITKRQQLVKNEMVHALGVALLELAYRAPIDTFKKDEDLDDNGNETNMTESLIATRLVKELKDSETESENFSRAVFRCINLNFETYSYSLADEEFRGAFYQAVVVPLENDYLYAKGEKR